MAIRKSGLLLSVLVGVFFEVGVVLGDTPANCTYEEILGEWIFHIGENGKDKTVNCTGFDIGILIKMHFIVSQVCVKRS